jgi:hypothetical protein
MSRGLTALPSERALEWRVVEVLDNKIFGNAGQASGLKIGERLRVVSAARKLIDPHTQAVLGIVEQSAGEIEILSIQDRYSIAAIRTNFQPKRGDAGATSARRVSLRFSLPCRPLCSETSRSGCVL